MFLENFKINYCTLLCMRHKCIVRVYSVFFVIKFLELTDILFIRYYGLAKRVRGRVKEA